MITSVYMTVPEMAQFLKVSRGTAYRLIQSGRIPAYRPSPRKTLVRQLDVEKYIKQARF